MKKIINVICGIFLICCATACEDMMDTESGRIAYDDQHELNNPNDSIYSVIGVLAQLQQVADRILIMGELRGDLMTVDNEYASTDLQEINDISFAADNSYAIARDFYSIINNCNYIIARMDTSITEGQNKVMMPEYAQVKTLRAYTYWQMALIFGRVNYFTMPLTSIGSMVPADANIGIDELSQKLIADISPIADARPLDYGTIDNWTSTELFYPTKMLLGDLYLYNKYVRQSRRGLLQPHCEPQHRGKQNIRQHVGVGHKAELADGQYAGLQKRCCHPTDIQLRSSCHTQPDAQAHIQR